MLLHNNRYGGALYRALNPVYARKPLSGRGAELYGGRFNPKGTPALYTSLDPSTALREANQVGSLQPTILLSYHANLGPVFDTQDKAACENLGITPDDLSDPGWRSAMLTGRPVPTQILAAELISEGFVGILVRSFATGARRNDLNLVLWQWATKDSHLEVVDDENRLTRSLSARP